jgi:hypothetical protein
MECYSGFDSKYGIAVNPIDFDAPASGKTMAPGML